MKRTPLKRKTPLRSHKIGQPPKYLKKTKLKVRSLKRQKEEAQYNKRVKEWKLEPANRWCKACPKIAEYLNKTEDVLWRVIPHPTEDCHHMAKRHGKLLMIEEWWLPTCRWGHTWIDAHANTARELGLLAPKNM